MAQLKLCKYWRRLKVYDALQNHLHRSCFCKAGNEMESPMSRWRCRSNHFSKPSRRTSFDDLLRTNVLFKRQFLCCMKLNWTLIEASDISCWFAIQMFAFLVTIREYKFTLMFVSSVNSHICTWNDTDHCGSWKLWISGEQVFREISLIHFSNANSK